MERGTEGGKKGGEKRSLSKSNIESTPFSFAAGSIVSWLACYNARAMHTYTLVLGMQRFA